MERERLTSKDFDQELWLIFDDYVHGHIDRRGFLDRAAKFAVGGVTAAMLLDLMNPKFAEADLKRKAAWAHTPTCCGRRTRTPNPTSGRSGRATAC